MGITAPSSGAICPTLRERMLVTGGGPLLATERNTRTAFTPQPIGCQSGERASGG